jgi:replicative DNA helicase Mcm
MTANPEHKSLAMYIADLYREYYEEDIDDLVEQWPDGQRSLVIDHNDVAIFDSDLAADMLRVPEKVRDHFEAALNELEVSADVDWEQVPTGVTIRFANFQKERQVGAYRPADLHEGITVVGQLEQISKVTPVLVEGVFECKRCGTKCTISQPEPGDQMEEPHECQGCERQGPFNIDLHESVFRDRQLLRIKTPPEDAADGESQLTAVVDGELAGEYTGDVGSRAAISGVLKVDESDANSREHPYLLVAEQIELLDGTGNDDVTDEELSVLTESETPIEDLTESMLPGIHSTEKLDLVKEALVLQLVASPRAHFDDGSRVRGDWHMLLLGDPGTAKSETIDEAHQLAPRSQIVGERVTAPGITASATKDDFAGSQWSIKAGALVRANDGLCAIDEIDKLSEDAVQALHNPMERQRVDASLADRSVSLPAYTAVLAAGNPLYGRFDEFEPIAEQIDFKSTLLSRFDLIFLLKDTVDAERDAAVGEAIANNFLGSLEKKSVGETDRDEAEREIPARIIRGYISRARELVPTIDNERVKEKAIEAYTELRQYSDSGEEYQAVPVTARKQAGIFRLAGASARARLSETIEMEDVERAVRLVRESLEDVGIDPETGEFDADLIETGTSKSQQQRIKTVAAVIDELDDLHDGKGPTPEDIAEKAGITIEKTNKTLDKLMQQGKLFEPQENHYRTT